MDYDRKRYPGLYSLRETLKSRPRTKLSSPEGGTSLMDNVPMRAQPSRKALTTPRPSLNALQEGRTPSQARKSLGEWGGKKFAGGMTTDQFVSLAGALGHAIAPDTPQGRVGSVMSQFGQQEMLRRRGMAETLRKEGIEREKLHTKTLIDVGAEERKRESDIATAKTLAGTKKAEAAKTQTRWEKTQEGVESRFTRQEQRLREQYGTGKKSGLEGFTYSQRINFNQEMHESVQKQLYEGGFLDKGKNPESAQLEENRLSIEYQRDMLPGYEPNPNIIISSGIEAETNKKLYNNWYGEHFEEKDGKLILYVPKKEVAAVAAPPSAKTKPLIHPKGILGQAGRAAVSPITESLRGWKNIGDWTGYGAKKGFEFLNKPRKW